MLFDITQLALERAIEGAGKRHEALAANLANANTPGYQRVDVEFHGAFASAGATRPTVDVESEAAKLAANALEDQRS